MGGTRGGVYISSAEGEKWESKWCGYRFIYVYVSMPVIKSKQNALVWALLFISRCNERGKTAFIIHSVLYTTGFPLRLYISSVLCQSWGLSFFFLFFACVLHIQPIRVLNKLRVCMIEVSDWNKFQFVINWGQVFHFLISSGMLSRE